MRAACAGLPMNAQAGCHFGIVLRCEAAEGARRAEPVTDRDRPLLWFARQEEAGTAPRGRRMPTDLPKDGTEEEVVSNGEQGTETIYYYSIQANAKPTT